MTNLPVEPSPDPEPLASGDTLPAPDADPLAASVEGGGPDETVGSEPPSELAPEPELTGEPQANPGSDDAPASAPIEIAAAIADEPTDADSAPPNLPRRHRRLRAVGAFAVAFAVVCLVGSTIGAAAIYAHQSITDGRVPYGVDVGGVDVSGLLPEEAAARVDMAFARMGEGTIILDGESGSKTISFGDVGRRVDSALAVERAMAVADQGTIIERALASARTALDGVTVNPTPTVDTALLMVAVDRAVTAFERPAIDATITTKSDGVVTTPGRTGRTVERAAIVERAIEALNSPDGPPTVTIPVTTLSVAPAVTDTDVQIAARAVEAMAKDVYVRHGDDRWKIPARAVRPWIQTIVVDGEINYEVDRNQIEAELAKLRSKIDTKPKNATFLTAKSGRVVGVKASKNGRAMDIPATTRVVAQAVLDRASGAATTDAQAVLAVVQPKLTTADAKKTAPLMRMISSHTTWFPYGERNFYGANIWIPGRIINGMVLAPGEKFDFQKVVGFPSASRGFGMGGAIINGRTEPTGALAGGICSTSTTLYNAAAKAGLRLGARKNHTYYIDRYPLGLDATVTWPGQNMTFTNDTKYPILIINKNWRSGSRGYIKFEMWSVPNGRKVRFSAPTVRNIRRATTQVISTTTLPAGSTLQKEFEHDGMDVWRTRTVTDAKGNVIHKNVIYSHYARVNGLILKGTADAAS